MLVLDVNTLSLEQGRSRAAEAGLLEQGALRFVCCDVGAPAAVAECLDGSGMRRPHLVTGLHCCGGLTEAALRLALDHSACWAVCSCCFASLPQLATLSTIADELAGADSREKAEAHRADRILARGLAQATEFFGQARAQRAINALRLAALASRAAPPQRCEGWLLEFPAEFSKQNSVLVGQLSGV